MGFFTLKISHHSSPQALEEEARLRKEAEEQAAKLAEMELRRQKAQQLKEEEERKEMARLLRIQHLSESRKFDDGRCVRAMWSKWKRICAKHRKREEVAAKVDEVMIQKRTWRAMGLAFAAVQLRRSEDAAKWQQARTQSCFIYLWRKVDTSVEDGSL